MAPKASLDGDGSNTFPRLHELRDAIVTIRSAVESLTTEGSIIVMQDNDTASAVAVLMMRRWSVKFSSNDFPPEDIIFVYSHFAYSWSSFGDKFSNLSSIY